MIPLPPPIEPRKVLDPDGATTPQLREALDRCASRRDLWDGVCVELEEALGARDEEDPEVEERERDKVSLRLEDLGADGSADGRAAGVMPPSPWRHPRTWSEATVGREVLFSLGGQDVEGKVVSPEGKPAAPNRAYLQPPGDDDPIRVIWLKDFKIRDREPVVIHDSEAEEVTP